MKDKKNDKHIIVVGDSTAGAIVSTYLKKYWKERVDITLISSSKIKSIGVGESTTPTIFRYLNFMGITLEDLVKNTNSTFKLGIKFKNWMNDGNHYYHNFRCPIPFSLEENYEFNFINSQEIIRGESFGASLHDDYFLENNYIPESLLEDENKTYAVHFDTFEFSNYLLKRFGTDLNIIDAKVEEVFVKDDKIEKILLDNKEQLTGDLYIDCSGFSRVLIKNLDGEWVDKKDYLPLDRAIPFSIHKKYDYIEPYAMLYVDPSYAFAAPIYKTGMTFSWAPYETSRTYMILMAVYSYDGSQLLGYAACTGPDQGFMTFPSSALQAFPSQSLVLIHLSRHKVDMVPYEPMGSYIETHMEWEVVGTGYLQ